MQYQAINNRISNFTILYLPVWQSLMAIRLYHSAQMDTYLGIRAIGIGRAPSK